jgi:hypothetical protein
MALHIVPVQSHGGKGVGLAIAGGQCATIGWDDHLRISDIGTREVLSAVRPLCPVALSNVSLIGVVLCSAGFLLL